MLCNYWSSVVGTGEAFMCFRRCAKKKKIIATDFYTCCEA